jgi:hypothetical protein
VRLQARAHRVDAEHRRDVDDQGDVAVAEDRRAHQARHRAQIAAHRLDHDLLLAVEVVDHQRPALAAHLADHHPAALALHHRHRRAAEPRADVDHRDDLPGGLDDD